MGKEAAAPGLTIGEAAAALQADAVSVRAALGDLALLRRTIVVNSTLLLPPDLLEDLRSELQREGAARPESRTAPVHR